MGWFVPQILGVGYKHVGEALNGRFVLRLMILLLVLKVFAVAISYASGNAGGIFGPSLFMGAMLGGVVGTVAQHFLPGYINSPGAYALVGRHGVCRHHPGADDFRGDDFRNYAGLCRHRAADDLQPGELLHFRAIPEAAYL
jgi:hypothetical protein